jgi:hypothetical protein
MNVQELCRKLKPVIGEKADRYWLAYLAEDHRGKQDIETALNLLADRHLGSAVSQLDDPLSLPPESISKGAYPLGRIVYANKTHHPFGIQEQEWIQHTAIFGRSGAGKTNTVLVILENFLNQKKPFLIFDWKRNYRDLLSVRKDEILVYTVGRSSVPFTFNPLIPPAGTDAAIWLKKLIEIIAHSYYLGEGVMFLLQEALDAVYKAFNVYPGKPEKYPTFEDILEWLEKHPAKGRKALWMDSTMRGVKSICFGHMGKVVNTTVQPNLASLLEKNVILELDGLTNADKTFIIESLLLWIHHYRLAQPQRETFKHAMIIEEAHHILLKRTGGQGGEAVTDTILREIRELGEAIVLVDQHPSLISIPALGNTYTTIAMNLKHRSDVNAIGAAMLMDNEEKDIFGRLPIGMAVIKLQGRWLQPFQVKIPHSNIPKGAINDSKLACIMKERNPYLNKDQEQSSDSIQPEEPPIELSEKELGFLVHVHEHPFLGTVERYRQLNLSRRKGNAIRQQCLDKGLLKTVDIPTKSGKVVLVELSEKGRKQLAILGHTIPNRSRWGSTEHEFWKHKVARIIKDRG